MTVGAAELGARAARAARALVSMGVEPGHAVGLLGPNHPEWAVWAFGAWTLGAVLVPLPFPLRVRDGGALAEQVASLVRAGACRVVLAHPRLVDAVPSPLGVPWLEPAGTSLPSHGGTPEPGPHDVAVIQFTSGSTAAPKGAILTHGAITAAVRNTVLAQGMQAGIDVCLSWLPFFHDWGVFGFLARPIMAGCASHVIPTERFAADPALWLRLARLTGATLTSAPCSAWAAAIRGAARRSQGIDLSGLRVAMFGAETTDPAVLDGMHEVCGPLGLAPGAVGSGYGMAEATLGVTSTRPGEGVRVEALDLARLAAEGRAEKMGGGASKRVASCGRPNPGVEVRVVGPEGPLEDRRIGEIRVRSPGLMRGYAGPHADDPVVEGWLRTGDLGYMAGGELFVTGRSKDVVIVMGRNYAPEDIEWAAGRVAGVRAGRCVAFSPVGGTEGQMVVVIERSPSRGEPSSHFPEDDLGARVRGAVTDAVGLTPSEVLVVPRGTIPKTTSGKLRRTAVRDAHAAGRLVAEA